MWFISDIFVHDKLVKGSNCAFIALIPKVIRPQKLSNYRPISHVGCMYKILYKVLANRLKLVIDSVISEAHMAFVKGRQILNGIAIENEVVDDAEKKRRKYLCLRWILRRHIILLIGVIFSWS